MRYQPIKGREIKQGQTVGIPERRAGGEEGQDVTTWLTAFVASEPFHYDEVHHFEDADGYPLRVGENEDLRVLVPEDTDRFVLEASEYEDDAWAVVPQTRRGTKDAPRWVQGEPLAWYFGKKDARKMANALNGK